MIKIPNLSLSLPAIFSHCQSQYSLTMLLNLEVSLDPIRLFDMGALGVKKESVSYATLGGLLIPKLSFPVSSENRLSFYKTLSRAFYQDPKFFIDEKAESRVYIGNLDSRITEAALIKMFTPYGKILSEEFLWHTRGPKRGEPRGFAFIQFSTKEEAKLAKEKMHGRLACGRPLVVRLASEKYLEEAGQDSSKALGEAKKAGPTGSTLGQTSRSAKIAAIKNKLRDLEEEGPSVKKQKQAYSDSFKGSLDHSQGKG
ncbi:hypothetical protein SADUNF_Sadunf04G0054600 [Salix dunnii]|uniref:RRM domain-containing protein n=1 Tax=Salix dunnii TaxID=1413687 RepID=A0A835MYR7_9ROSI|nr:hypothetical protein SADUNF_Sadunf04G0054600 [Salix dunnii]